MNGYFDNICLLVNDNPLDQEIFGRALNDVSPETFYCIATNCHAALEMITVGHFKPDIIFVELDMPGMDGVEFLKRLKSKPLYKDIDVIVHTFQKPLRHLEILEAGAVAIYSKEYDYAGVYNILYFYGLPLLTSFHLN
jgi:CheY-like chemotaxis protein